jgi:hypothetical protein
MGFMVVGDAKIRPADTSGGVEKARHLKWLARPRLLSYPAID